MKKIKACRSCGATEFIPVLNFGQSPLVNSLLLPEDFGTEKTYPLKVSQCVACHLVQVVDNISGQKIYRDQDYLYFSSDMPGLSDYFADFAVEVKALMNEKELIVEIGSNDGIFLQHFKERYTILGVDPSTNVVVRALKEGVPTVSDFFSERLAKSIVKYYGKAKVIAGSNCIAHLEDLHDLLKGVVLLLDENGVFVVECNYWGGMVENANYSLIYHDHFSYFTAQVWADIMEKYGLEPFDAVVTPAQGGSLRIYFDFKGKRGQTNRLVEMLKKEEADKLNSELAVKAYQFKVKKSVKKLKKLIDNLKVDGKRIAGYGAAAKGFSALQLAKIGAETIEYFVDDSPAKQGKFAPVSHIPVISRAEAESKLPDYFLISAPNYSEVIIKKEQKFLENGGKFITIDGRII